MTANYHSHCDFCDGRAPMEEFVRTAIVQGIDSYGISSHAPLPFPNKWTMKPERMAAYRAEFSRLKKRYEEEIELHIGLEADYIAGMTSARSEQITQYEWDYLIGSVHHVDCGGDGVPWIIDAGKETFEKGLEEIFGGDIKACTRRYFQYTNEMVELGGFDIVGHIDKIHLNGRYFNGFDTDAEWYVKSLLETLDLVKEKGLIVEINTKATAKIGESFLESTKWKHLSERHIPIVVSSDCHTPGRITAGFEETQRKLKAAGFKTTMRLSKENQWEETPLP